MINEVRKNLPIIAFLFAICVFYLNKESSEKHFDLNNNTNEKVKVVEKEITMLKKIVEEAKALSDVDLEYISSQSNRIIENIEKEDFSESNNLSMYKSVYDIRSNALDRWVISKKHDFAIENSPDIENSLPLFYIPADSIIMSKSMKTVQDFNAKESNLRNSTSKHYILPDSVSNFTDKERIANFD